MEGDGGYSIATEDASDKELRDAGFTSAARSFPMSDAALACLCAYNGIGPEKAPRAWRYAPNAAVRDCWERVAALNSERSLAIAPPIGHPGPDVSCRISGGVGTAAQQTCYECSTPLNGPYCANCNPKCGVSP